VSAAGKGGKATAAVEARLATIAQSVLGLSTLETRLSDRLDFHELAVWSIRRALEAAYVAGVQDARTAPARRPGRKRKV
jgi:hypothetical protein